MSLLAAAFFGILPDLEKELIPAFNFTKRFFVRSEATKWSNETQARKLIAVLRYFLKFADELAIFPDGEEDADAFKERRWDFFSGRG